MSDFWSRRKDAARAEDAAEAEAADRDAALQAEAETAAELAALPEEEQLAKLGLPDPDRVVSGDDVAAFMARAVPKAIRNRALRSLWRSNPVLACVDGLNDYDGDFTGDGLNGGVLRTTYEVGKGLTAHLKRLATMQPDENGRITTDEMSQEQATQVFEEKDLAEEPTDVGRLSLEPSAEEVAAPVNPAPIPLRRMRFTYTEDPTE